MKTTILALVLFIAIPANAHGQFASAVAPGARVRVAIPDSLRQRAMEPRQSLLHGTVSRVTSDSLYLRMYGTDGTVAIDRLTIKRLAVSRGMQSPVESILVKGIGTGVAFALSSWIRWQLSSSENRGYKTAEEAAAVSGLFGLGFGGVVGAIWPTEKWKRVRLGK